MPRCIFRRYRINFAKRERTNEPEGPAQKAYAKGSPSAQAVEVAEAPGNGYSEADGGTHRVELEGDSRGWEAGNGLRSPT